MIKVSSTNASSNGSKQSAVRVYKKQGLGWLMVGEVFLNQRNPRGYLKAHPGSKYNKHLKAQLKEYGLTDEEIAEVYK